MVSQCSPQKNYGPDTKTCQKPYKFELEVKVEGHIWIMSMSNQKKVMARTRICTDRLADRRTDRFLYTPLNLVHGGIIIHVTTCKSLQKHGKWVHYIIIHSLLTTHTSTCTSTCLWVFYLHPDCVHWWWGAAFLELTGGKNILQHNTNTCTCEIDNGSWVWYKYQGIKNEKLQKLT